MTIPITNPAELREILSLAIDRRLLSSGRLPIHNKALRAKLIAAKRSASKKRSRRPSAATTSSASLAKTLSQLSSEEKLALAIELGLTS